MPKDPAVQGCAKKTGVICVVVTRSDQPGVGAPGVTVTLSGPSGGTAVTDANGIAQFADRKPGSYKYKLALPNTSWQAEPHAGTTSASAGKSTIAGATVYATGTLVITVHDDLGRRVDAETSSSVAYLAGANQNRHTDADLSKTVASGNVSVSATARNAELYAPLAAPAVVTVPEGGTVRAALVLRALNRVTPTLELSSAEAWFLRPDPAPVPPVPVVVPPGSVAVAAAPPAPPTVRSTHVEPPVTVRVGLAESLPAKPYTGTGSLLFDATRVKLFRDAACTGPALPAGAPITNAELKAGLTLYAKGADAGASNVDLRLTPSANAEIVLVRDTLSKPLTVREINVVEPVLKVEHRVVVWDRKLVKHQKSSEPVKFVPTPTFVDLSVTQRIAAPPYLKTATLLATPANVEAFTDEACKKKFDLGKPIDIKKLTGATALRLYLKSKALGRFELKLTLAPSGDAHVIVEHPAAVPMGVAELVLQLYREDEAAIAALTVNPDVATYHADLQALVLSPPKLLTDKEKVADGRLLHAQDADESFGRARLVIKKLDAAQWPAGVDNYKLVLASARSDTKDLTSSVKVFDKDCRQAPAATELALPALINVSELIAAEKVLWVEGGALSAGWRSIRLDLGLDRADPAAEHHVALADKKPVLHGDVVRFTIVKLKNVDVEYKPASGKAVAWDAAQNRFYVNVQKDPGGRAMTIGAELEPKLKGVNVHLMLVPHEHNRKAANWGIDMPGAWTWETISADVKHKDRKARNAYLSFSAETDGDGKVKKNVVLSRFGGDKFWPAAHLGQDPHLAKFVDGHATLSLRKPVRRTQPVEVFRKFWVQKVAVAGIPAQAFAGAAGQYLTAKAEMVTIPDLVVSQATAAAYKPVAIYPRYMVEVNGGAANALVVSDPNKGNFFKTFKSAGDKPNTVPILVCDAQWDPGGTTAALDVPGQAHDTFPLDVDVGEKVLDPPLQGGKLVVSGTWVAHDWDPATMAWINPRSGNLTAADVAINQNRADLRELQVNLPAAVVPAADGTDVRIDGLVVKYANSYLGESFQKRILAVFDPGDPGDFQNTIAHELGHAFAQVIQGDGGVGGLPAHPEQIDAGQGNHCNHNVDECVMFASSQPVAHRLNSFCEVCRPYMLVQDMSVTI